ncbi:MAG: hypothetical protein GY765_19360, partial [bacterium]|nr:hypothetical protein [bacterium]
MRKPFVLIVLTIIFLYAALFAGVRGIQKADIGKVPVAAQQSIKQQPNYGKTPLYFIPNKGQVNQKALFYAKAKRYTLWMTHEGLVFDSSRAVAGQGDTTDRASANFQPLKKTAPSPTFERDVSRLFFLGANKSPQIVPVTETEHKVNYFIGNDKSKWQADIATSKAVLYREVYKGIDLKVYGIEKQIEYDWIVKPGAQVDTIAFQYENVKGTAIDEGGNLVVTTEFGDLVHKRPISFQVIDGEKKSVNVVFKKIKENAYGFEAEAYDTDVELIIDPLVTVYSTYLGGDDSGVYSQDKASGLDVDANGCVYVLGHTAAPDFPVSNAFQGNISHPEYKQSDITITKFSPDGSSLIYSTYLGGGQTEQSGDIAIDSNNCAYLTGNTTSVDFPVRFPLQYPKSESWDIFVTKLSAAGDELIYSTYLGRSGLDYGKEIEVDENGRAYIAGETTSTTFPVSVNGYSNTMNGTEDIILIVMSSTGQSILYSTFLGSDGHNDKLGGMTLDSSNSIYLTGYTDSTTFPVTENAYQNKNAGGLYDAFVSKINSTCTQLLYSTYLGGTDTEFCNDIAVDNNGAIY